MFRKINLCAIPPLTLTLDGRKVTADRGESIASVLLRQDDPVCRTTPVHGAARAPFCMMGVCFECLAVVDGVPSTQTCLVGASEGMCVQRQRGRPEVAP